MFGSNPKSYIAFISHMFLIFFNVKEHSLFLPFFLFLTLRYLRSIEQLNYFRIQVL